MKTLKDIEVLEGVKVLVRADFNVPIKDGVITDAFRIQSTLPTIDFLCSKGAKVILISHLESSDGGNGTLEPIADYLKKSGRSVTFIKDWKNAHEQIENMNNGTCLLMENIRLFEGEKKNDPKFAKELASLADIYVSDAFSVSHRKHASVVGVPALLPSYAGLQLEKEITNLSKAFSPDHPFIFLLGGAKFETKLPLLKRFFATADSVLVGGVLANDIYKEKGYEVGISLISKPEEGEQAVDLSEFAQNAKLILPSDVLNQDKLVKPADSLSKEDKIMDAGPKSMEELADVIAGAKFILWNGPLGLYEEGFKDATLKLAGMIGQATQNGAMSMVGGGDTLAAIDELGIEDKFTFISTGGGAMLDFLANGTLPGIEALNN